MSRYFFNLREERVICVDDQGIDLPDIDAARREALAGAKDLINEQLRQKGTFRAETVFEVADDKGVVVHRLAFRDLMAKN